jgi:uncharacterized protein (DUF305 family)
LTLSRRGWTAVAVAAAVLLLALGYTAGLLTAGPTTPGENSAEAGFARDMSTHHAQAVELGMIAFQNASRPEIRSLGGDIAITQQGQIGVMSTWLTSWGLGPNSTAPPMSWMPQGEQAVRGNLMPGMATREEVQALRDASGARVDILFCQYMLRHHIGGIHMVDGVLARARDTEVRALAETMKKNQSGEVVFLRQLLDRLGAQPLP